MNTMKISTLSFVVASALSFTSLTSVALAAPDAMATAQVKEKPAKPAPLTDSEQKAAIHIHHVNQMEITMGKMAGAKGTAGTKKYGAMLATDHAKADKELVAFAKKHGLAKIPDEVQTDAEKADMTAMMAKMKAMKPAEFDAMCLQMMVDGHEKELAMQPQWIAGTTDADMKAMLDKRTVSLTKHRDAAKELLAKAAAGPTTTTTTTSTTKPTTTTTTTVKPPVTTTTTTTKPTTPAKPAPAPAATH